MKYDFDTIISRRGTNSYKWDIPEEENVLPMWVADMDFRTAPAIIDALQKRVAHGIFGYTKVPEAYYDAVVRWFDDRHRWQVDSRWIIYTSGVVPALSAIIKALAMPGDKVIVQTPAYNCFYSSIRNDGCELFANNLIYQDGRYVIDFADLERKASDPEAKSCCCAILTIRSAVWTPEELQHIGDICLRNEVFVVADEIHCELTYEGYDYIPFASLSERFFAKIPSLAFRRARRSTLPGCKIANIIAADEEVRRRIDRAININEVCDVNPFGVIATMAAYNEGGEWLDALRKYLRGNYEYLCRFFKERLPQYPVLPLEGTYLVWIDCSASGINSDAVALRLQEQQHLMVNSGTMYGPGGEGFYPAEYRLPPGLCLLMDWNGWPVLFYREVF